MNIVQKNKINRFHTAKSLSIDRDFVKKMTIVKQRRTGIDLSACSYPNFARILTSNAKTRMSVGSAKRSLLEKIQVSVIFLVNFAKIKITQLVKLRKTRTRKKPYCEGFTSSKSLNLLPNINLAHLQ